MLNLVSLCHLPYMLWEASKTKSILVSGFGLCLSPCPNPAERSTTRSKLINTILFNTLFGYRDA